MTLTRFSSFLFLCQKKVPKNYDHHTDIVTACCRERPPTMAFNSTPQAWKRSPQRFRTLCHWKMPQSSLFRYPPLQRRCLQSSMHHFPHSTQRQRERKSWYGEVVRPSGALRFSWLSQLDWKSSLQLAARITISCGAWERRMSLTTKMWMLWTRFLAFSSRVISSLIVSAASRRRRDVVKFWAKSAEVYFR